MDKILEYNLHIMIKRKVYIPTVFISLETYKKIDAETVIELISENISKETIENLGEVITGVRI